MHIRLLLLTYFLQFFPDLVKMGHVFILETPLLGLGIRKKLSTAMTTRREIRQWQN